MLGRITQISSPGGQRNITLIPDNIIYSIAGFSGSDTAADTFIFGGIPRHHGVFMLSPQLLTFLGRGIRPVLYFCIFCKIEN